MGRRSEIFRPHTMRIETRLPRRPTEHPATQHVKVDVINGLAGSRIHVEYCPVTFLMDIRLHRQCFGNVKHLADKSVIFRR
jgi:hypothetical protein